jgi:hypothetical protein
VPSSTAHSPRARLTGRIVATKADAGIGRAQKPYLGTIFEVNIDCVEAMHRFSFHWHPLATDQKAGYPGEPTTLVAFDHEETAGGTRLTITESGIDQIPPARRGTAAAPTEQSWTEQATSRCLWRPREIAFLVEKFLARRDRPSASKPISTTMIEPSPAVDAIA